MAPPYLGNRVEEMLPAREKGMKGRIGLYLGV